MTKEKSNAWVDGADAEKGRNGKDGRSDKDCTFVRLYTLTDRGKRFVIEARTCVVALMDEQRGRQGKL